MMKLIYIESGNDLGITLGKLPKCQCLSYQINTGLVFHLDRSVGWSNDWGIHSFFPVETCRGWNSGHWGTNNGQLKWHAAAMSTNKGCHYIMVCTNLFLQNSTLNLPLRPWSCVSKPNPLAPCLLGNWTLYQTINPYINPLPSPLRCTFHQGSFAIFQGGQLLLAFPQKESCFPFCPRRKPRRLQLHPNKEKTCLWNDLFDRQLLP